MRHKNAGRKFDRNTSSRKSMFRNLTANLVLHERIETEGSFVSHSTRFLIELTRPAPDGAPPID